MMFSLNLSGSKWCSIYLIDAKAYQTHFIRLKTVMYKPGSHIMGVSHLPVSLKMEKSAHARTLSISIGLKVGDMTDEDDQRLIKGIIPDMVINARGRFLWWKIP